MTGFAVCDDEPYMLEEIARRLSNYMEYKKYAYELLTFSHSTQLLQTDRPFDVLFLDIRMGEPDGMKLRSCCAAGAMKADYFYHRVKRICV